MHCHCQHWQSQVATGRNEALAAVGTEDMRWESGGTGSDPLFEPGIHCRESVCLLQCCCRSAPLTWQIAHTEIDRMADSMGMEHILGVA